MTYEQWRISYQDSEQAARAAFNAWQSAEYQCAELTDQITRSVAMHGGVVSRGGEVLELKQERDQLRAQNAESMKETRAYLQRLRVLCDEHSSAQTVPDINSENTKVHLAAACIALSLMIQWERERDQLKVALELVTNELESWKATEEDPDSIRAIKIGKQAINDCKGLSLAEHDAQVIERFLKEVDDKFGFAVNTNTCHGTWVVDIDDVKNHAYQLRQKAQEVSGD